jgi:hypothetical protein
LSDEHAFSSGGKDTGYRLFRIFQVDAEEEVQGGLRGGCGWVRPPETLPCPHHGDCPLLPSFIPVLLVLAFSWIGVYPGLTKKMLNYMIAIIREGVQ